MSLIRPPGTRITRLLAGPIVAAIICADHPPGGLGPERLVGCAGHLTDTLDDQPGILDTDLIMRKLPQLVQEEAHAGRELVISETHGALSTNLRLLEQQAREIRREYPALYELASRPTPGSARPWPCPSWAGRARPVCRTSRRR